MRLGQLARKLAVRPLEIVDFLAAQQIEIESGSNTRLDDAHVISIMQHFAPTMVEEVKMELAQEVVEGTEPPITSAADVVVEEPQPEVQEQIQEVEEKGSPETILEIIEVIKAPKVELPGLKVVGKIDLPEPKKKELSAEAEEGVSSETKGEEKPQKEVRKSSFRAERKERPRKNPVTVQREREQREAEQKRRTQEEREKEIRKLKYQNKIKTNNPASQPKPIKVEKKFVREITITPKPEPTTLWGKFSRWLFRG